MVQMLRLAFICLAFLPLSLQAAEISGKEQKKAAGGDEILITLQAPLFSEAFSETPVAMVNEEPITFRDLTGNIASMHSTMASGQTTAKKDYANLLDRLITVRLICQEARNIGLHQQDDVQAQIDDFRTKTLLQALMARHLRGLEPEAAEVDKLYRQMSRELLLWTLRFPDQKDAVRFRKKIDGGADFKELSAQFIAAGKAEGGKDEEYAKLKDLQPQVAMAAFEMKTGSVSQIYQDQKGALIFRIEDYRFVEDPGVRKEARQKALQDLRKEKAREYSTKLEEKYATVDDELLGKVDFDKETSGYLWFEETKPVDFDTLLQDQRILATVHGEKPVTITVADVARKVKATTYHGVKNKAAEELNKKKDIVFHNMLFKIVGTREAKAQGLDQTQEFKFKLEEYENSLLFGTFLDKVIAPEVKLQEEEVREYYDHNKDEYSTPPMFRLRSIAFVEEKDAKAAFAKLNKGADFKWVSANAAGQADKDNESLLSIDQNLLSLTAMPEDLHHLVEEARKGDFILYLPADNDLSYVLAVTEVYPAKPRPYEQVRGDIAKILFNQKLQQSIDNYVAKLKEAYETKIFVQELDLT